MITSSSTRRIVPSPWRGSRRAAATDQIRSPPRSGGGGAVAYLAAEAGRPHCREALAEMLWPDRAEGAARANLRHTLRSLRLAIGDYGAEPPFLIATRETIALAPDGDTWVDVRDFTGALSGLERRENPEAGALEQARSRQLDRATDSLRRLEPDVVGLTATDCTLVVPRVDDCIAIFLGSHAAYKEQASQEPDALYLLIDTVQAGDNTLLRLNSANPKALAVAIKAVDKTPLINSISGEPDRLEQILPIVAEVAAAQPDLAFFAASADRPLSSTASLRRNV